MSELKQRAAHAARQLAALVHPSESAEERLAAERRMADEYAAVLGLDLPEHKQLERFKRATEGAPVVHRVARPV